MNRVLKYKGFAELALPLTSSGTTSPLHTRELTSLTGSVIKNQDDTRTSKLALPLIGELAPTLGKAGLTPNHRHGGAGSAPHLRGVVPVAQTDQLSCHPSIHPGL